MKVKARHPAGFCFVGFLNFTRWAETNSATDLIHSLLAPVGLKLNELCRLD